MKKFILLLCAMMVGLFGRAQNGHEEHAGEHAEVHDPARETPRALLEGMAEAIESQEGEHVLSSFTGVAPRFGLAVQRGLFAEAGVSLDIQRIGYTAASEYLSFGYSNLRPYVAGEMLLSNKLLGGGKAGVEYIRATPVIGMAFGADVSYFSDGAADAVLLTPRLMLSFVRVEVFYGYNFFLRNGLTRWIGHHRFGVSMTLNPRFWRRKNEIYGDYYNSYLEE